MRAVVGIAAGGILLAGCSGSAAPATPATPSSPASEGSGPAATAGVADRPPTPARAGVGTSAGCAAARPAQAVTGLEPGGLTGVQFVSARQGWVVGADRILSTTDGGAHWTVQDRGRHQVMSVDFISDLRGWAVGASSLLATSDGGRNWTVLPEECPLIRAVHFVSPSVGSAVAGGAGIILYGGAAPEVAGVVLAHAGPGGAVPIFAEQYFPHPGVVVSAASPGPYPAALSALSSSAAVYVDYCSPCGYGTGPWDLVTGDGATLSREGNVGELNQPVAASFLTPALGWVVGTYIDNRDPSRPRRYWRVVTTSDGGRTWQVDYTTRY